MSRTKYEMSTKINLQTPVPRLIRLNLYLLSVTKACHKK